MNIFITGANRGLGYELVCELLSRGHHVVALVRNTGGKKQLEERLNADGVPLQAVTILLGDVRDEASIQVVAEEIRQQGLRLQGIINSAAVLVGRQTDIERLDMDDVQLSFDVNLFGPLRVIKHMLPLLEEKESSILNISSEAGSIQHAYAGDYPYSLSKCGLNLLSEQLKRLLASRDIAVWSIHPGWMRTDMGGEAAPLHPRDSAASIVDILERKAAIETELSFINYRGEPMEI